MRMEEVAGVRAPPGFAPGYPRALSGLTLGGDMTGAARWIERIVWALAYLYLLWLVSLFLLARRYARK